MNEQSIISLSSRKSLSRDTSVIWRRCSAHLGANNSRLLRPSMPIPGFRLSRSEEIRAFNQAESTDLLSRVVEGAAMELP